jgi:hypothetical protein
MIIVEPHIFSLTLQLILFITASTLMWVNYLLYRREIEQEQRLKRLLDVLYSIPEKQRMEKISDIVEASKRDMRNNRK